MAESVPPQPVEVVVGGSCTAQVWQHTGWHRFLCSRKGKRLVAGRVLCEQHAKIEEARIDR